MNHQQSFDDLWTAFLEGELDEQGLSQLQATLEADPKLAAEAADLYAEHRLLGYEFQGDDPDRFTQSVVDLIRQDEDRFVDSVRLSVASHSAPSRPVGRLWLHLLGYAAAACVAIIATLALQKPTSPQVNPDVRVASLGIEYVATVLQSENCQWDPSISEVIRDGARLANGKLDLVQGKALIRFDGGAMLVMQGPAELKLESAGSAYLASGHVTIRAPEEAIGFILRTPHGNLVDWGTEFAVSVNPSVATELHVLEGEVEWRQTSADAERKMVTTGQAIRIDASATVKANSIPVSRDRSFEALSPTFESRIRDSSAVVYEGFDYPFAESLTQEGKANGGTGWKSPWFRGGQHLQKSPVHFTLGKSLHGPASLAESIGGRLELTNYHRLPQTYTEAHKRRLASPIRLDRDGVHYISFLVRRSESLEPGISAKNHWMRLALVSRTQKGKRIGFGVLSDRRPFVFDDGTNTVGHMRMQSDRTFLCVGKIVTSSNRRDQLFFKLYEPSQAIDSVEPAKWTIVGRPTHRDLLIDEIHIYNGRSWAYSLDEIRIGTSWQSVTPMR